MRYQSSVTSLSWIPSEAIQGGTRLPFDVGMAHYDPAPPDEIDDLDELRRDDRFRFANRLSASIQVNASGEIIAASYTGAGMIGSTTVKLGPVSKVFEAVALPDIKMKPVYGDGWVRFTQTAGGRTGMPAPRRVRRAPFVQWQAPLAWTTLSLTMYTNGESKGALVGASRFPRHWVYDDERAAQREVRTHRLRRLVPQVLRQGDALGPPGLRRLRHDRRDRARTKPLAQTDGRARPNLRLGR